MRRFSSFTRQTFGVRNAGPWRSIISHSLHQFHENDLFTSAAAMSYFGLMALFPALLLMLAMSNRITAANELLSHAVEVYPGSGKFLRETIRSMSSVGTGAIITCFIVTLWAGSWVFAVIERALNRIWQTTARTFWHGRALTIGMIGIVGVLLAFSVLLTSLVVRLRDMADRLSPRQVAQYPLLLSAGSVFWQGIFAIASFLITVMLFVIVYRFMPKAEVTLRDTLPGAIIGGLLWEVAKYVFAWALTYFHYDQIYGSVGAVVAVLTWSYVSSLILLFGAQLTAVFHREHPHFPTPAELPLTP
ncbi:MAG TPA: YihY/virulence factor BrkB family protein [Pyrinomonadaceae bacterium]|jgi:membrane protein|nr:YihY/virulence factor BrkB family protein [Pyrinomonadaceae bacterium]